MLRLEPFQSTNQTEGPPPRAWCVQYAYDGSGNLEYAGYAQSQSHDSEWSVSATSLTDIVVAANVATATFAADHGLEVGHRIQVHGATDEDLNVEAVVASVPAGDEITFATVNVANATFNNRGLRITTQAPRTNAAVWSIKKYFYNGSNVLTKSNWAEGQSETADKVWDSRSTYAYM